MKAIRRLTASVLAFALMLGSIFTVSAKNFSDVPNNHWAYDYVSALVKKGVVNGYEDGTFKPTKNVTRAEWAKMLTVTADIPIFELYKEVIDFCSEDVKSDNWASPYLATVLPFFPFGGTESPYGKISVKFEPSKSATRLEVAKSIVMEKGYSLKKPDYNLVTNFSDYLDIPEDDMKYVAVAVEHGIIQGFDDGTFKPDRNVTRAEAATILYRAYIGEKEVTVAKKPYVMSTFVDAKISTMLMVTLDSLGNMYYIDETDNIVYKINMRDRKKVEYYDVSELEFEEDDGGIYSNYSPQQIYYDNESSRLILNGYFKNSDIPGEKPKTNGEYHFMFDITDVKNEKLFYKKTINGYRILQCIPNDEMIALSGYSRGSSSGSWASFCDYNGNDVSGYGRARVSNRVTMQVVGNNIYSLDDFSCNGAFSERFSSGFGVREWINVEKYNYTTNRFEEVVSGSEMYSVASGMKNGYVYFVDEDTYTMFKIDLVTLKFTELPIVISDMYIEFSDKLSLSKCANQFLVINDSTYIFYDYGKMAFRILEKNESAPEEVARQYDDNFYSFYDNYME